MQRDPREVIIRPVITEHSYDVMDNNVYTFEVAKDSNKIEIRQAIEAIFGVTVTKVNTLSEEGLHAHVEEGHGDPRRGRHHRDLLCVELSCRRGWLGASPFFCAPDGDRARIARTVTLESIILSRIESEQKGMQ